MKKKFWENTDIPAPKARKIPHHTPLFNYTINDPWYWIRDKENTEVISHLQAENVYAGRITAHLQILRETLYNEILGRITEDDSTVPERDGLFLYYSKTEQGKSYEIHCRKANDVATEEIILDENLLAAGHEYFDLGDLEISEDHRFLAYSTDMDGSEKYTIRIKDLSENKLLNDVIINTNGTVIWLNDQSGFYYASLDQTMRPYRVYLHLLHQKQKNDVLVYEEKNLAYSVFLDKSKSRKYIFLGAASHISTEYYYIEADHPQSSPILFHKRADNIEYALSHQDNYFFIVTNENATNFKLYKTEVNRPEKENWIEVLPENPAFYLEGCECFKEYIVLYGRQRGNRSIKILFNDSVEIYEIPFPDEVYTFSEGENPEYDQHTIRLEYSSPIYPKTIFDFDLRTKTFTTRKEQEILGGYDRSLYHCERQFAQSADGTSIPVSLVYKKTTPLDYKAPCYLTAYGAYGYCYEPRFSSTWLSLLDRGFVIAIAHIRGGSEMGRHWYEEGKLLNKMNSFSDLIASARFLCDRGYTCTEKLAIEGGSAGGLLVCGTANMAPDICRILIANVPFVDVLQSMLDESLPLTVIEYDEWGNPQDKEYAQYIKQYSPYDNVKTQHYPLMIITAGLNDPRVGYWEPVKLVQRIRELKTDTQPVLCRINMGAGHQGKSGRYGWIEDLAWEWAIAIDVLTEE